MADWQQEMGLSEETDVITLYVPEHKKQTYKEEAEERGMSLSRYCYVQIEEARFQRQLEEGEIQMSGEPDQNGLSNVLDTEKRENLEQRVKLQELEERLRKLEESQE